MQKWLKFLRRTKREQNHKELEEKQFNLEKKKEDILDCIAQGNFSELGIDIQLIEELFYKALDAGIIKIIPTSDGGVRISITNLEIETFPIKINRKDILKYFFYD